MRIVRRVCKLFLSLVLILSILGASSGCSSIMDMMMSKKHEYIKVNSAEELFVQFYDSVYRFEPKLYIKTASYADFNKYWDELLDTFAIHNVFREADGQIYYREVKDGCNIEFDIHYNTCGQALQYLVGETVDAYPTPEAEALGKKMLAIVNDITTEGMSDADKAKKIHDYLITHGRYNLNGDTVTCSKAETLINTGSAQCQGYAEAFCALCLIAGVQCRIITGNSTFGYSEQGHAWCQVNLNGMWYHVDVTWDDPIPDVEGMVSYDYFLKGDMSLQFTHSWCGYFEECMLDYRL